MRVRGITHKRIKCGPFSKLQALLSRGGCVATSEGKNLPVSWPLLPRAHRTAVAGRRGMRIAADMIPCEHTRLTHGPHAMGRPWHGFQGKSNSAMHTVKEYAPGYAPAKTGLCRVSHQTCFYRGSGAHALSRVTEPLVLCAASRCNWRKQNSSLKHLSVQNSSRTCTSSTAAQQHYNPAGWQHVQHGVDNNAPAVSVRRRWTQSVSRSQILICPFGKIGA